MSQVQQPSQLDYAPRPRGIQRRWLRRIAWIVGSIALLLVSAFVSRWAYERATLYYWTQKCMTFSRPPGTVAYEENPAAIGPLWASVGNSRDYTCVVDSATGKTLIVVMRPRAQWETSIRTRVGLNQFGSAFLHTRNAGNGDRIVCIGPLPSLLDRRNPAFPLGMDDFMIQVMRPGTLFTDPQGTPFVLTEVAGLSKNPFGTVRLFVGQPDANDASHFTIDYQIPTGQGTIDGYLQSDDTVKLTDRGVATTQPATTRAR